MSNCSNCYNGCTEIVSDRCVKYTGIDVPVLGIKTGDSLSFVEQALIEFLTSTLDGTGIKIDLGTTVVCNLVQQYLPTCGDLTIVDISKALIEAACDLQEQVDAIDNTLTILNADYTIGCLTGVTASSDTHAIVQAVITKLCQVQVDLTALASNVRNNYVPIVSSPGYPGIDEYIQAYLDSTGSSTLVSNKMVPYSVLPYFGTLANFDGTGAGTGNWLKIYLCNGQNGTPDLRGRTLVGTTTGMFGGTLSSAVNFNIPGSGNPNYTLGSVVGANQITLDVTQIPSHTHVATATTSVTDTGHRHKFSDDNLSPTNALRADNDIIPFSTSPSSALISAAGSGSGQIYETSNEETGIAVQVNVSSAVTGGGLAHANIQPSIGSYFIIYIP